MSNDPTSKTATDLITGALRKIGMYAPGETLAAADLNDALDSFNGLLDVWSAQQLTVYNNIETVQNLTAGQANYTVGLTGYFNIERPLTVQKAYSRINTGNASIDFPCQITTLEKYGSITMKGLPGPWPKLAYYNTAYPLSDLFVWPVPQSNIEFHIWSQQVFSSMNLTTLLNLPRGYYLGLQFALAELLCPEYGLGVPPSVAKFAKEFKSVIKSLNAAPQAENSVDASIIGNANNDASFILHGGFA